MHVRVYATVRAIVGGPKVELDLEPGETAIGLARRMVAQWPELEEILLDEGKLSRRAHVFLNGRSARHLPEGEDTVIQPGDEVDVFPAVAGG